MSYPLMHGNTCANLRRRHIVKIMLFALSKRRVGPCNFRRLQFIASYHARHYVKFILRVFDDVAQ